MARIERIKDCIDNGSRLTNRDLIAMIDDDAQRKHLGLTTESFEFVVEVEAFVEGTLERLVGISRKLWATIPTDFDLHYALNYRDTKRGRSNASTQRTARWRSNYELKNKSAGNCINLNSLWSRMRGSHFKEYAHIKRDPQIGDIETADWKAYVEVLLCHELAHILDKYVVDHSEFPFHNPGKCRGHGQNWQNIYRRLRIKAGHVKTRSTKPETIQRLVLDASPKCLFCGSAFTARRSDAKFCCAKCKVYWNRKNKVASEPASSPA